MREAVNTGLFGEAALSLQTRIVQWTLLEPQKWKGNHRGWEEKLFREGGREHRPLPSCQQTPRREKVTEPQHTRSSGGGGGEEARGRARESLTALLSPSPHLQPRNRPSCTAVPRPASLHASILAQAALVPESPCAFPLRSLLSTWQV